MKLIKFLVILVGFGIGLGIILGSCGLIHKDGDDSSSGSTPNSSILILDKEDELPTCNEANKGLLVLIKADKTFRHCLGTSWDQISLEGTPGEDGASSQGLAVYDSQDKFVGIPLFIEWPKAAVMLEDFYTALFSLETGKHSGIVVSRNLLSDNNYSECYFVANNCTGECVVKNKPFRNSFVATSNGYFAVTGSNEVHLSTSTQFSYGSRFVDGTCNVEADTLYSSAKTLYSIPTDYNGTPYTFPDYNEDGAPDAAPFWDSGALYLKYKK